MGMVDFEYVDDQSGLRSIQRHLRGRRRISVDLESDSYYHYEEKIALMQICDGSRIFILDPLNVDMGPMASLLKDGPMEKVFHDIDYDGRMLLTFLGVKPVPIFDTMIAARILGKEKLGLADLLGEYFGMVMDKGLQKADWSRRPLSMDMLEYAALDVAYLLPLRDRLAEDMEASGRMDWAREEFSRLVNNLEPMPERKASILKVKGARDLSPRQLAVLQKLLEWRERRARSLDLPSFKVVGTERLLKIAQHHPRTRRELEGSGSLSPRQAARFGGEILNAVEKGMKVPGPKRPRFPAPVHQKRDFAAERILKSFKNIRDRKAEEIGLDPGFLMPNAVLKTLARMKPAELREIRESGLLKDWQLEVMGESLVAAVREAHRP
jgi:ribonuclease D